MAESSEQHSCDNCGAKYQLVYETEEVSYDPDNCPFCGDVLNEQEEFSFSNEDSDAWESDVDADEEEIE